MLLNVTSLVTRAVPDRAGRMLLNVTSLVTRAVPDARRYRAGRMLLNVTSLVTRAVPDARRDRAGYGATQQVAYFIDVDLLSRMGRGWYCGAGYC